MNIYTQPNNRRFAREIRKGFIMAFLAAALIAVLLVLIGLVAYLGIKENW